MRKEEKEREKKDEEKDERELEENSIEPNTSQRSKICDLKVSKYQNSILFSSQRIRTRELELERQKTGMNFFSRKKLIN